MKIGSLRICSSGEGWSPPPLRYVPGTSSVYAICGPWLVIHIGLTADWKSVGPASPLYCKKLGWLIRLVAAWAVILGGGGYIPPISKNFPLTLFFTVIVFKDHYISPSPNSLLTAVASITVIFSGPERISETSVFTSPTSHEGWKDTCELCVESSLFNEPSFFTSVTMQESLGSPLLQHSEASDN